MLPVLLRFLVDGLPLNSGHGMFSCWSDCSFGYGVLQSTWPLGSMEATYNEPNDIEAMVPYDSTMAAGGSVRDSFPAELTSGNTVATALNQTGGPSWPKRFSAA